MIDTVGAASESFERAGATRFARFVLDLGGRQLRICRACGSRRDNRAFTEGLGGGAHSSTSRTDLAPRLSARCPLVV